MDDWRNRQQKLTMNSIGPMHNYHSVRSRPTPYPINEIKQTYQYQQSPTMTVKTDSNSNLYTPLPYPSTHMEQIHNQSSIIAARTGPGTVSNYNSEQQQQHHHHHHHQQQQQHLMSARARSLPYPSSSMYNHSSGSICQYTPQHMNYSTQNPSYYQNYYSNQSINYQSNSNVTKFETMKMKAKSMTDEHILTTASHNPSNCSNSYIPPQQILPQSQEYQIQLFPSPSSNPSTPYQNEFNTNTEFGVPYHQGQPSSVNSLTDALCPSGDTTDRQMTPGPPSIGTPRVTQPQYSFPQTPCTPTTSRLSNEPNIDELTAFLQDPVNTLLTDDMTSTLLNDIEALADTYLGGGRPKQQSAVDNKLDYDIILNYLCSDDLINTVCTK